MAKKFIVIFLLALSIGSFTSIYTLMATIPNTALPFLTRYQSLYTSQQLDEFIETVKNGQRDTVVGIFVPGKIALRVEQQPKGNAGFVTRKPDLTTQFAMPSRYGTIGILAHNDLAGANFSSIQIDNYAVIVYGDGRLAYFVISEVQKYQALSPTSNFSDFINLDGSKERLTASDLFSRVYTTKDRLVLQTCIKARGDPSWGRLFIIGRPASRQVTDILQQGSLILKPVQQGFAMLSN